MALMHLIRRGCIGEVFSLKALQAPAPWVSSQLLCKHVAPAPSLLKSLSKPSFSTNTDKVLASQHTDHNHTPIWTAERVLSAALLGLLPAAFISPNGVLDYAAALVLTTHIHWGVEAIVIDYIRPSVVGATLAKVGVAAVYVFSALTLGGLFYFNYNDVGLMQAVRMLWRL